MLFDAGTCGTAVVVLLAAWLLVHRSPWLLALAVMVGCAGLAMLAGLRPLARGEAGRTVSWLAVANWAIAMGATAVATFAWPLMVLAALLPAVFAAPYTSAGRLRPYLVVSLAVAMGVAALGLLQDFSGLTGELPDWLPPTVIIFFTPFLGGMIAHLGLSNNARLRRLLDETHRSNERLLASQSALRRHAEELRASRARVVAATDRERRRMERDLHDGTQQRLVAMGLKLSMIREQCLRDPERAALAVGNLRHDVREAQAELRRLTQGMFPQVLTEHGLVAALQSAADRLPNTVTMSLAGVSRYPPEVEAAVYFCCVEALQNVAKHAGHEAVAHVRLRDGDDGVLFFEVADDGRGFDPGTVRGGSGLENLADRLGAAGGTIEVTSARGAGTIVTGQVPALRTR